MEPSLADTITQPIFSTQSATKKSEKQGETNKEMSLSTFYPEGTEYFYSFPSGEDSNFFNSALPCTEELVASRCFACAGKHVKVISFASTMNATVLDLRQKLGLPNISTENILVLPPEISTDIQGQDRNCLVKEALRKMTSPAKFVMAQPYLDSALFDSYQLPPNLVVWLNDKRNIPMYVPLAYVPTRITSFKNGAAFRSETLPVPIPCVVKVSSSSAGDGVIVCRNAADLENAKQQFRNIKGPIFIEQYIEVRRNFCVQFGIPSDKNSPIEIIGCSEQLTTSTGEFLGGVVHPHALDPDVDAISEILLREILPKIRSLGWYGVGGLDALLGQDGHFYIIDANFRMTATMVYLFHVQSGLITPPFVTFTGEFHGTLQDFERVILPIAKSSSTNRCMHIVSLSLNGDIFRFNAAMFLDNDESIGKRAADLLSMGIKSRVLTKFSSNKL
ncbi:MAG TPA: hypothetical protein VJB82_05205 [Candidatus Peribacterales bacterium]|nr:hypothetical protein [Candidatus Peribacterales bacterium]